MIPGFGSFTGVPPIVMTLSADVPAPTSAIARFYHTFRKWKYSLDGLRHQDFLIDTTVAILKISYSNISIRQGKLQE
jgi:hypothetical protein